MARVLIVGCGCRGRELAAGLISDGHAVRGTTRRQEALGPIEAVGAEAVVADPDRLGTLLPALEAVSVVCWLLGPVAGEVHGSRLSSFLELLVDTPVRGFVYEGDSGAGLVRRAGETYRMRVRVVPDGHGEWLPALREAVAGVLDVGAEHAEQGDHRGRHGEHHGQHQQPGPEST